MCSIATCGWALSQVSAPKSQQCDNMHRSASHAILTYRSGFIDRPIVDVQPSSVWQGLVFLFREIMTTLPQRPYIRETMHSVLNL